MSGIARVVLVPVAFLAALAVTVLVLVNVGLERISDAAGYGFGLDAWRLGWGLAGQIKSLVSLVAVGPALLVVLVGERARVHSILYWLLGGVVAAVAAPVLSKLTRSGVVALPPVAVMQVMATAGLAGGYVYWLIAGRPSAR